MTTDTTHNAVNAEHVENHVENHAENHAENHGMSNAGYVRIAAILAAITALEVSTVYIDFGPFFLPALLIMMAVKFIMVVSYFMHLKFDNKLFSFMFYAGLILAVGVYAAFLATFHFFIE